MIRVTSAGMVGADHADTTAHHYEIAKQRMVFQSAVANLKAYEIGPASANFSNLLNSTQGNEVLNAENAQIKYQGVAPFYAGFAEVIYWRKNNEVTQVDVGGVPVCQIDLANTHIHVLNNQSFDDGLNLEVVMGPALMILLAARGIYCLHAGAVATPQGNVAMVAESGTGKSTLSKHVGPSWSQLADDILPLEFIDDIELVHQFPQLKLDNARIIHSPIKPMFLKCILRLNKEPAEQTEFKQLGRTDSLLQVVRHTVAARLFDHEMMREHARFAKRLTGHIPMVEVSYARDLDTLDKLREDIAEYIGSLD